MGQPDVNEADVQLETYIRKQCLRNGTYSTEDVRRLLSAHRAAAVAKRQAEIAERLRNAFQESAAPWDFVAAIQAFYQELIKTNGGA